MRREIYFNRAGIEPSPLAQQAPALTTEQWLLNHHTCIIMRESYPANFVPSVTLNVFLYLMHLPTYIQRERGGDRDT